MKQSYQMDPVADLLAGEYPVAYRVSFAHALGGACVGLLLSQLYYWSSRQPTERHGWFYLSQEEITTQTGLTRTETETARRKLREAGVLNEERRGLPARLWFRLDTKHLYAILRELAASRASDKFAESPHNDLGDGANKIAGFPQTGMANTCEPVCRIPTTLPAASVHSITENSSETISENIPETTTSGQRREVLKGGSLPLNAVVVGNESTVGSKQCIVEAALVAQGITSRVARMLVAEFGEERCLRQLEQLSYRKADSPAAVLRRSIEEDWSPPLAKLKGEIIPATAEVERTAQGKNGAITARGLRAEWEHEIRQDNASKEHCEALWMAMTKAEQDTLMEAAWRRAIEKAPPPVRTRLELAAKSSTKPTSAVCSLVTVARNELLSALLDNG